MATFRLALNLEYARSADKSFEEAVRVAGELGYRWVEPMVHTGWELLSEVQYFHSFSMEEDPLLMGEICGRHGVGVASLSGHSPLMKPEAAVSRLTRALVLADAVGAGFVNTDEMVKPGLDGRRPSSRGDAVFPEEGRTGRGAAWHHHLR
jgi:sugar phosphate isomerase/epimerase